MRRIIVVRGGAIGDFVLTLPAIKLLRDNYCDAHIEILGYKHIVALAENRFYANAVRSIESGTLAGFFAIGADLLPELADYFHRFDLVVSYLFDPDRIFEQNVKRCGVDEFIACNPKIAGGAHAAVQLASALEQQLGLPPVEPAAVLFPGQDDRVVASAFLKAAGRPICAIHPGSGSAAKNWAAENWRALGDELLAGDIVRSLLIIGGEADAAPLSRLRSAWHDHRFLFAENLSLPHLAAVLERCTLFLGHDSGISHIAAAVGTPSVLLFGATDPKVWAPANKNVRVIRAANAALAAISVAEVAEAARALATQRSKSAL
jgi:heptosyltransferase-2